MSKPVAIPNTFATATTVIPLSNLDGNFTAVATSINSALTYSNYAADTGAADAYVVTFTGLTTTYTAGLRIQFKAANANTGASTINVNAQGTKSITFQNAAALTAGIIAANSIVDVMYDGTQFLLMNDPAGLTGGDVVGPASATDNAVVRFDGTTGKLVQNSVVTIADSTGDIAGAGSITSTSASGILTRAAATQDGVELIGRAGGSSSYKVTLTPTTLGGNRTLTLPDTTGTVALTGSTVASFSAGSTGFTPNTATTGAVTLAGTLATTNGGTGLTSFTANGVVYASSSSALATGSALTFDGTNLGLGTATPINSGNYSTLTINGTTGSQIAFKSADVAKQYIYTTATDITYRNDNGAQIWFGGSELMRLTSTGLGIGTSSPAGKLTVFNNVTGSPPVQYLIGDDFIGDIRFARQATIASYPNSYAMIRGLYGSGDARRTILTFWTSDTGDSTERMRLDSSGNLGLGVTPSAWSFGGNFDLSNDQNIFAGTTALGVGVNAYYNAGWKYKGTGNASYLKQTGGTFQFFTAPSGTAGNAITFTQAMTLDANGRLALGTTSASGLRLTIEDNGNQLRLRNTTTRYRTDYAVNAVGTAEINVYDDSGGVYMPLNFASSIIQFSTGSGSVTERARITSGGDLLLGITTFNTTSGGFAFAPTSAAFFSTGHATGTATGTEYANYAYNGVVIGSITQNGTTGVLYNITSDYRLKTVTGPVSNAGLRIDALEPVEYTWKSDGSVARGFLAHQFQEVYPNSVTGEKDAVDADGKPVYQNMQASTSEVIADLVAEIKSLRQRVAQLEGA